MVEIREQDKIETLEKAWYNCGVLSTATTGKITCLPIYDVRNVENIDYAFAVDDDFKEKTSYIDTIASMETVDPGVVTNAESTFENNKFRGVCTGSKNLEHKVNLKTMFANNVDLTVDGIPSDDINGKDIFEKLSNIVFDTLSTANDYEIHNHVRYFPYLDGHTTCFSKNQGELTIGDGNVAAVNTSAITNEFSIGTPNTTGNELQTEVAFSVTNDGSTKTILSKTTNDKEEPIVATGDTQTVKVEGSGQMKGGQSNSVSTGAYTLSWNGIPCTKKNITYKSVNSNPLQFPNNMNFKVCHVVTIAKGTKFIAKPGSSIRIENGGSIVVEKGATVELDDSNITITADGRITNYGLLENTGTITNAGLLENTGTINNNTGGSITNNNTIYLFEGSITNNNGTITNKTLKLYKDITAVINGKSIQGNQPRAIADRETD